MSLTMKQQPCNLSGCVAAVISARMKVGKTAVVLGQGVMGLFTMQLVRASGAKFVVATDIEDQNLAMSAQLGAETVVDASREDVSEHYYCSLLPFNDMVIQMNFFGFMVPSGSNAAFIFRRSSRDVSFPAIPALRIPTP